MKRAIFGAALLLPISAAALAQSAGLLGEPAVAGTGCPQESAAWAVSPDGQTIAVLFDDYGVEIVEPGGRPLERETCSIAIPVDVPEGQSVAVFGIDFLGYNLLPEGAETVFSVEYFFAGDVGETLETAFAGPLAGTFHIQRPDDAAEPEWSPCGEDVILRANSSLLLRANGEAPAISNVAAAVGYRLQWQSC